ncbi:MAG: SDR family oxidoreductase [Firmicutes bacterium]|nr:SDR family oxidoreductase [Bacillota bacterium]
MHYDTMVISGASGGIGSCIAIRAASFCDHMILLYNSSFKDITVLTDRLSGTCDAVAVKCDLSDVREASKIAHDISDKYKVDALVNNAGISLVKLLQDCTDEEICRLINVNLTSAVLLTKAFIPGMIAEKRGCIVNVSSVWGEIGASCEAVYSASKAGLNGFTQALARELGPSGIRVNSVCPGMTDTRMNKCFGNQQMQDIIREIPLGRIADPDEIAAGVMFLLSDKSSYINGQCFSPNGGMLI